MMKIVNWPLAAEAFSERMRACRELCEDFRPNDSTLRVAVET